MNAIAARKQLDDSSLLDCICWEKFVFIDSSANFDSREHIYSSVLISQIMNETEFINTNIFDPRLSCWDEHDKGFDLRG